MRLILRAHLPGAGGGLWRLNPSPKAGLKRMARCKNKRLQQRVLRRLHGSLLLVLGYIQFPLPHDGS